MKPRNYFYSIFVLVALVGLWSFVDSDWLSTTQAASLSASELTAQAWREANTIGQYKYQSNARQTTRPTLTLSNAGLPTREEQIYIETTCVTTV